MMDFFYDLCYMFPLNLVVTLCFLTYRGEPEHCLTGCISGSAIIIFVRMLRHIGKKERYLILGAVAVAGAGLFWVLGEEKRRLIYEQYSFLIHIAGIAVLCIIVGRLAQSYLWAKLAVAALLLTNAVYLMVSQRDIPGAAVALSFLLIMIYLVTIIQSHWDKNGYTDLKKHTALVTPLLLIVVVLVCVIPAPKEPYDWQFAKNIWKKIVTEYKRISASLTDGRDGYAFTGFSSEGTPGGGLGINNSEVMALTTESKAPGRIYIGGITFEDFVSNGWMTDLENENDFRLLDVLETRAAIYSFNQGYERDYIRENTLNVENRLGNTRHLFLPSKVNPVGGRTILPDHTETEGSVLSKNGLRYGDSYLLSYYRLNFSNPELIALMDNAEPVSQEVWNTVLKKAGVSDNKNCSYEDYLRYRSEIYEKYGMQAGASAELREVIEKVTEGIEGDYEKLLALAEFLQTMKYSLNPGLIPAEVTNSSEYLDYFILESQEGYCVHFATAFVLLARECGFPARYVQGYNVDLSGSLQETTVTEANAHSWAEVYFDNFGWVVFEATPGFSVSPGWRVENYIDVSEEMENFANTREEGVPDGSDSESSYGSDRKSVPIRYIVIPVVLAIFFGILYLYINVLITKRKYSKMSRRDKINFMIMRNLRILRRMGYSVSSSETIGEFRRRIGAEDKNLGECTSDFLILYERLLYSNYEPGAGDVLLVERNNSELKEKLRRRGRRYILGINVWG